MITQSDKVVKIRPRPHFVVKTRLLEPSRVVQFPPLTKVFCNICSSPDVPPPPSNFSPQTFELIMNNSWEVPILSSTHRSDRDKKGEECVVFDCVINEKAMVWVQNDKTLREIVIEWCLESVEVRGECTLDREKQSIPKMTSKGEPAELELVEDEKMEKGGVGELLEMKRLVEDEEMEVEILPKQQPQKSPLIQEIKEMTLNPPKKVTTSKLTQEEIQKPTQEPIRYSTSFKKIDLNGWKLKIEIISQITSSLDYSLSLDRTTNTLIVKSTNPRYKSKDLELPLPTIFDSPEIKSFYVSPEKKLVVFVK